jgi:hypothetical protein
VLDAPTDADTRHRVVASLGVLTAKFPVYRPA